MGTAANRQHPRGTTNAPFAKLFDRLSVRARVAALGVVPIIGFLAYGLAYMASDIEVGRAFDSVRRDNAVVEASSDLKSGLLAMRLATVTFATHPSDARGQSLRPGAAAGDEIARPYRGVAACRRSRM